MKNELLFIIDKVTSCACKSHFEPASINIVHGNIEISCCCDEFKRRIERRIEYEFYKEFAGDDVEVEVSVRESKIA